jgi:hypothetical protein
MLNFNNSEAEISRSEKAIDRVKEGIREGRLDADLVCAGLAIERQNLEYMKLRSTPTHDLRIDAQC